jgi:hypothetical protein
VPAFKKSEILFTPESQSLDLLFRELVLLSLKLLFQLLANLQSLREVEVVILSLRNNCPSLAQIESNFLIIVGDLAELFVADLDADEFIFTACLVRFGAACKPVLRLKIAAFELWAVQTA